VVACSEGIVSTDTIRLDQAGVGKILFDDGVSRRVGEGGGVVLIMEPGYRDET
jgi:hypothetical protein